MMVWSDASENKRARATGWAMYAVVMAVALVMVGIQIGRAL